MIVAGFCGEARHMETEKINKLVVFDVSSNQCTLIFGDKHFDNNNNK